MSTSAMINPDMEQIVDYDNRLELLDEYEKVSRKFLFT